MSIESSNSSSGGEEPAGSETIATTFSRKERKIHSCMDDNAVADDQESLSKKQRRSIRRRKSNNSKKIMIKEGEEEETTLCTPSVYDNAYEEDEKVEIEKKIVALQRIVPGGESIGVDVDKLFEETAGYILALQFQVKALKFLTNFVEASVNQKSKLYMALLILFMLE